MSIVALVPLRSLHDGKQRLRAVLSAAERTALVQNLFQRTAAALARSGVVARIGVVSPDPALLAWAGSSSATPPIVPILQPDQGLNAGLEYGRRTLLGHSDRRALLVVLPDLPRITAADIQALARLGQRASVVLVPDRHGRGTNALLLGATAALPFRFGIDSRAQHTAAAHADNLTIATYETPGMALDIDTADDLRLADLQVEPWA